MIRIVLLVVVSSQTLWCSELPERRVKTGAEELLEKQISLVEGKRIGLITNQTGRLPTGEHLVAALLRRNVDVVSLLAPEHGFSGQLAAGDIVSPDQDTSTGITVHSLYGETRKPTQDMLQGLDILIYDLQDVGVRFYTFISTMGLAMEAAAAVGIPFVVLDRPNPLGGIRVEGPLMDDSLKSFVGMYPIPVIYGLTCGELARMIVGEEWLSGLSYLDLKVIPMEGWSREMLWDQNGLSWIPPSPNIPDATTALIYPATCYFEATNLSEGRGTTEPFRLIGAPFLDGETLAKSLNALELPGVEITSQIFSPRASKHEGVSCEGFRLRIINDREFQPVGSGLAMLTSILASCPEQCRVDRASLSRLVGSSAIVGAILAGSPIDAAQTGMEVAGFRNLARKYFLYE
jgi:uncharacterized protein YbbC (DUF1343 family)